MNNVDVECSQVTETLSTPIIVTLKLWTKKPNGRKSLVYEAKSLEVSHVPQSYTHGSQVFVLKGCDTLENGDLICSYNKIGKCSKCHKKPKSISYPPQPFDHWCDRCYTKAPLVEKSRKCSRGEKRKAIEIQQREIERKKKVRATALLGQAQKKEDAKKSKSTNVRKEAKQIPEAQDSNIFDEEFSSD